MASSAPWCVDDCEAGPPGLVAAQNFIEALFERYWIELAGIVNGYRLVVERNVGNQLRMHPDLFLGVRQGHGSIGVPARNLRGRKRNAQFAAETFLE